MEKAYSDMLRNAYPDDRLAGYNYKVGYTSRQQDELRLLYPTSRIVESLWANLTAGKSGSATGALRERYPSRECSHYAFSFARQQEYINTFTLEHTDEFQSAPKLNELGTEKQRLLLTKYSCSRSGYRSRDLPGYRQSSRLGVSSLANRRRPLAT